MLLGMRSTGIYVSIAAVFFCTVVGARAQDPTKAAPDSYKLQMENEYVRVLRVLYAAHSKVPVHDHSRFPAAYVYLTDSGPIVFTHTGWDHPVLTRPAIRAGSFRLSPTRFEDETHAVENPGDKASEFLRIEIRTQAPDRKSLVGRFAPFTGDRSRGVSKVEFDNSQVRVTRLLTKPGEDLDIAAPADSPSLCVFISDDTGSTSHFASGDTRWLRPHENLKMEVLRDPSGRKRAGQVELLRFDFKTAPPPNQVMGRKVD
jgi:hypothetical protein